MECCQFALETFPCPACKGTGGLKGMLCPPKYCNGYQQVCVKCRDRILKRLAGKPPEPDRLQGGTGI